MPNTTVPFSGGSLYSLIALAFLAAGLAMLTPVACAEGTGTNFFNDWNVAGTGQGVHVDLTTPPFMIPDNVADTTFTPGYYDNNGCPIGLSGAPRLRDAGFSSGAECRGACGPDCPTGRCKEQSEIVLPNRENTGTCWYYGVITCPTHTGCQEHDSCYDWCERNQYTHIWDTCHLQCNQRCFDKYGYATCSEWADLPGRAGKYPTKIFDFMSTPSYNQPPITYSYPPRFIQNPPTIATTSATQMPSPIPSPATTLPVTTPTILPTTTSTTTPTTKATSGPDMRLTVILSGDVSAIDMEGTTIGWSPDALEQSCSGGQCVLKFPYGTSVDVGVMYGGNVRFIGWSGSCSGAGACTVTMNKDKTVTAQFGRIQETTPRINYYEYCETNYPGSHYNPEEGTCEFRRVTPTMTPSSGTVGEGKPTLIPLTGACCPGESCSTQIADATGGTPPYHFSSGTFAGGGAPPMGMIIGLDGVLTGTAPAVGTYSFSVCVTDLAGKTDCGVSSIIVS